MHLKEEWLKCDQNCFLFLSKKVIFLTYTCLFSFIALMKVLHTLLIANGEEIKFQEVMLFEFPTRKGAW